MPLPSAWRGKHLEDTPARKGRRARTVVSEEGDGKSARGAAGWGRPARVEKARNPLLPGLRGMPHLPLEQDGRGDEDRRIRARDDADRHGKRELADHGSTEHE